MNGIIVLSAVCLRKLICFYEIFIYWYNKFLQTIYFAVKASKLSLYSDLFNVFLGSIAKIRSNKRFILIGSKDSSVSPLEQGGL